MIPVLVLLMLIVKILMVLSFAYVVMDSLETVLAVKVRFYFVYILFTIIIADINECDSSPCDTNAECENTDGSFVCTCNIGYSGDGFTCQGSFLGCNFSTSYSLIRSRIVCRSICL